MNTKLEEKNFGFFKVACAIPELKIADVYFNSKEIVRLSKEISKKGARLIVFPELSLTGYSCGDLFYQSHLLYACWNALGDIQNQTKELDCVVVLGLPIKFESKLYNSAAILFAGKILGIVPKSFIPNTYEFYEKRWFQSGSKLTGREINFGKEKVPFGVDLIFSENGENGISIGVEICEDLWMVSPPSNDYSLAGATIIANLSASNELLGKYEYRKSLIENQSAKCNAAYIYSSSGVNESSSDMVFSGHGVITENGKILNETNRFCFSSDYALADIDLQILSSERLKNESFSEFEFSKNYRKIEFRFKEASMLKSANSVSRVFIKNPFVPEKIDKRNQNCREIISIQSYGLAKRLKSTGIQKVVLGVSGGLDSTLALLVSVESFKILGIPLKNIYTFSLPGFGTTERTKNNSKRLSGLLQISYETISIHESMEIHFKNIGQDPNQFDSTFENSQARERTQILMDLANKLGGIV
ncbi:MAG: NAD(+) synthase, partial [Leptospiraceae bacterium]|nr:NAD(+) synthase [Leptospiraceae bacterium]